MYIFRCAGDDAEEFKPFKRFLQPSNNAQSEKEEKAAGGEGGCPFSSLMKKSSKVRLIHPMSFVTACFSGWLSMRVRFQVLKWMNK